MPKILPDFEYIYKFLILSESPCTYTHIHNYFNFSNLYANDGFHSSDDYCCRRYCNSLYYKCNHNERGCLSDSDCNTGLYCKYNFFCSFNFKISYVSIYVSYSHRYVLRKGLARQSKDNF